MIHLANKVGGAEGSRTPDLSIANAALSQLSYGPTEPSDVQPFGQPENGEPHRICQVEVRGRRPATMQRRFPAPARRAGMRPGEEETQVRLRKTSRPVRLAAERTARCAMNALFNLIANVIDLYIWVLILAVIASWLISFNVINTTNRVVYVVVDFLYRATEPVLRPIRRFLPNLGGLDISPIVLVLLLIFVQDLLRDFAYG